MRRAIGACLAALLGAVITLGVTALPASAVRVCEKVADGFGNVRVHCYDDGSGGGGSGEGGSEGGGSEGGGPPAVCRNLSGVEIPCSADDGYWTGSCYAKTADPQPPFAHPAWGGRTDGVIISCTTNGAYTGSTVTSTSYYWAATAPTPTIDPAALARQAVSQMSLKMGTIGSTPPNTDIDGDSLGIVGTPIWLWVSNPAENTTGPITRSASDGGITVTATGRLDRIEWALINSSGTIVAKTTCSGASAPGTAYSGQGLTPSPTCGIAAAQNQRVGEYTLRGTAHWVVEWAGAGQSGTITVPGQSADAAIRIGELQTIITTG